MTDENLWEIICETKDREISPKESRLVPRNAWRREGKRVIVNLGDVATDVTEAIGSKFVLLPARDEQPYASLPEPLRTAARKAHGALHTVWTKNTHQPGYVKDEWKALGNAIDELIRMAK